MQPYEPMRYSSTGTSSSKNRWRVRSWVQDPMRCMCNLPIQKKKKRIHMKPKRNHFSNTIKPESQNALPSVTGFSKSSVSDVKSKTYVSKNFKASIFVPTEPGYKIKLKQLSG